MKTLGPPPQTFGERLSAILADVVSRLTPMPESAPKRPQQEVYMKSKSEFYEAYYTALAKAGFEVRKATSPDYHADIFHDGKNVAFFTKRDAVLKNPFLEVPERLIESLEDIARSTALRCGICSKQPYDDAQVEKMKNGVVKINAHNGVVLTCKAHPLFDYVLCTYRQDPQTGEHIQPQYFYNRDAAFEDYATRSGLVDARKLFTETQLKVLYAGLVKLGTQDQELNEKDLTTVKQLVERIEDVIPELKGRQQEFDFHQEFGENDWEEERG